MSFLSKLTTSSKLYEWKEKINAIIDYMSGRTESEFIRTSSTVNTYHQVGDTFISFEKVTPECAREYDGSLLSKKVYADLWTFVQKHESDMLVSDSVFRQEVATNGYCGKFAKFDDNDTRFSKFFRLPYIKEDEYTVGVYTVGNPDLKDHFIGSQFITTTNYVPDDGFLLDGSEKSSAFYNKLYKFAKNTSILKSKEDYINSLTTDGDYPYFGEAATTNMFKLPNITTSYFKHIKIGVYYTGTEGVEDLNVGDTYISFSSDASIPSFVSKYNGEEINSSNVISYAKNQNRLTPQATRNTTIERKYSITPSGTSINLPLIPINNGNYVAGVVTSVEAKDPSDIHLNWSDLAEGLNESLHQTVISPDPYTRDYKFDQNVYDNDVRILRADGEWTKEYVSTSHESVIDKKVTINAELVVNGEITGSHVWNACWNQEDPNYGDIAEYFPRGCPTEMGDIIALDETAEEELYIKAVEGMKYMGVASESYKYIMGGDMTNAASPLEHNRKKYIPVALVGRVPVKVLGAVHKGDYIRLSSKEGIGIASKEWTNDSFGIALETNETLSVKLILTRLYK